MNDKPIWFPSYGFSSKDIMNLCQHIYSIFNEANLTSASIVMTLKD